MIKYLVLASLFMAGMFSQTTSSYNYNFQNYPVYFDHLYHGRHATNNSASGQSGLNNMLTQSALTSLLNPAVSTNVRSNNVNFMNEWNNRFGYNFLSLEAVQENIGCRARCRRLSESPVCGDNMTRYFNSCDAECDQVTYGTGNLRYNNQCCCLDSQMSLESSEVYCVSDQTNFDKSIHTPKMILNECLLICLQKNGDSVTQNSDSIFGC